MTAEHEQSEQKQAIRRRAYDARKAQDHKESLSVEAVDRFMALPEYQNARVVMWYVHCRSEVRTTPKLLEEVARGEKKIVIPYCTEDPNGENMLGLWHLTSSRQLVVGKWKIPEPAMELRGNPAHEVAPAELDVVLVPAVAFDRRGHRLGNGQGYYDRLLEHVRSDCSLVGLGYESQLFDRIPVGPHDIVMNKIVTETTTYQCKGRASGLA